MIVTTSCPLRISLVGGSTDHPYFLEKYKMGSVISFPSNLNTYTTVHKDIFGANSLSKRFVLNYSKREEIDDVDSIQNELIKFCFKELRVDYLNLFLTSDVYSYGSGLASSSSYIMSLVKSICEYNGDKISDFEICEISLKIEKNFNPLVGQQDFYGSLGGLKKIDFFEGKSPNFTYLDKFLLEDMEMYLIYTGVTRKSTNILQTLDIDKCLNLLDDVVDLEWCINNKDSSRFHEVIKRGWDNKKKTSKEICSNEELLLLDEIITKDKKILSHKLLGAGNGGYFLIFTERGSQDYLINKYPKINRIYVSDNGIISSKI